MTPFPCSDPGPRSRIPLAHFIPAFVLDSMHASFHYARRPARNNNPMAVITMSRMTLKTPSSRLQGRALLPGGQGGLQKH